MLDIKDCIRIDIRQNSRKQNYRIYVFKCIKCTNDIYARKCYFPLHSGECKSCSSKRIMKENGQVNRKRPFEARYNNFISKTRLDNPKTDITYEDYLEYTKIDNCHYCERKINWEPYGENIPGFFLDRMDNNRSHTKDNVVVCCGPCNQTKRNYFTYEEFLKIGKVLKEIRIEREKV